MVEIEIKLKNDQLRYTVGDTVSGSLEMTLPEDVPVTNVLLTFHCIGQVKWVEYVNSPFYHDGYVYYDDYTYHEERFEFKATDAKVEKHMSFQKVSLPFWFHIPDDKSLPSTMVSNHGSIQYFVRVNIPLPDTNGEVSKAVKEVIVQSPMKDNLLVSVGGAVEKNVLLHGGNVLMQATINRKGFYPGETINVHINIDNKSTAKITPRITLNQLQIFMCGARHKTVENQLTEESIVGKEIQPLSEEHQLIALPIPEDEALTIKGRVITVKYYVRIILDIPHAFDLQLNLPIVLTAKGVLEALQQEKEDSSPGILS